MTYLKIISVFLTILISSSLGELSCGTNEVEEKCPTDCGYNYCPKHELQDKQPCPKPEVCPPPSCKCPFNHRRAENGTCIPTYECPPFSCSRANEVFNPCPPLCPGDDCSNASPSGLCPFYMLFVIECQPSCRCIEGYWRNKGICVPYKDCPNVRNKIEWNDTEA